MSTLWTFGDSFTAEYTKDQKIIHNKNFKKYKKLKGLDDMDLWSTILAKKMGFELKNLARMETSNYQIFQDFCDNVHLIQKGDVVVIGWTQYQNYRIAEGDKFLNIEKNKEYDSETVSQKSLTEMFTNREQIIWLTELYRWINGMNQLAMKVGFKFYIWNAEDDIIFYSYDSGRPKHDHILLCPSSVLGLMAYMASVGDNTIEQDSGGKIKDNHLSKKGHDALAKLFYYQIVYSKLGATNNLI